MTHESPNGSSRRARDPVFVRYVLLQIPEWVLGTVAAVALYRWAGLPAWVAAAVVPLLMLKDVALYPWLRASYEIDPRMPVEQQLVGARAVATQPLSPRGYVRLRGELWQAEIASEDRTIDPGATVEVIAASGLTLVVREAPPG